MQRASIQRKAGVCAEAKGQSLKHINEMVWIAGMRPKDRQVALLATLLTILLTAE